MKRGQLSRADLLKALLAGDHATQEALAKSLSLSFEPLPSSNDLADLSTVKQDAISEATLTTENKALNKSPTAKLTSRYWQLVKQENKEDNEEPDKTAQYAQKVIWRNRPDYPKYDELIPLKDLRTRVLPVINKQSEHKRQVDLKKLIKKVSRAEFIQKIPRKPKLQGIQALHIIDDRQPHLIPYWLDHGLLTLHLFDELADYQISRAVIQQGDIQPKNIVQTKNTLQTKNTAQTKNATQKSEHLFDLVDYQMPPTGTAVLILSDLGRLSYGAETALSSFNQQQNNYWGFIQKLIRNGNSVSVISPCQPTAYPQKLKKQIQLLSWEEQTTAFSEPVKLDFFQSKKAEEEKQQSTLNKEEQWVNLLLQLSSPCQRLEPELLRGLRRGLRQFGINIPAEIESLVWQHVSIKSTHSVAATFDPDARKILSKQFKKLDTKYQHLAINIIRNWHAKLAKEIWFTEVLALEASVELPNEILPDVEDAHQFIQQINTQEKYLGEKGEAYLAWIARQDAFLDRDTVQKGVARRSWQRMFSQLTLNGSQTPAGHEIDPDLVGISNQRENHKVWLCQWGNELGISYLFNPSEVPKQNTSLIAPIAHTNSKLKLQQHNKQDKTLFLTTATVSDILSVENSKNIPVEGELIIKTDHTILTLKAIKKPDWATAIGRDAYGLYADLEIAKLKNKELLQRFRWIPAGSFMMGSPKNEAERYNDEDYHRVHLSQGYWLADTTVTQDVWLAVMGENPANFKADKNPVEQISWDDTQKFISRLNQKLATQLEELVMRLPTEAEWEYACRANTKTPFSLGENITPEQVNFNGKRPYSGGEKGEYREKTIAVKSLLENPWGLYEMHGNVWEWCADAWQEQLGEQVTVDPYYDDNSEALRVVRGGSWDYYGRYVRSAFRYHFSPDYRGYFAGFRLSLGHELQLRSKKKG